MFPVGFSGKPGAHHRKAAGQLRRALEVRGYTVTWGSLTAPLSNEVNGIISDFRRPRVRAQGQDPLTRVSERYRLPVQETAKLQVFALQDLGTQSTHGYALDNPFVAEASSLLFKTRNQADSGFYLRKMLLNVDHSSDFLLSPDVRSEHEAKWFSQRGIVLRFTAREEGGNITLDDLDGYQDFYGWFRQSQFNADKFADELIQLKEGALHVQ